MYRTLLLVVAVSWSTLGTNLLSAQSSIYVSSRNSSSVKLYNGETGRYIRDVVQGGATRSATQDVVIGADGNLYVSWRFGSDSRFVYRFQPDGTPLGPFTSGYDLDEPTKLSFGPDGDLYVSQWGSSHPVVARFDGTTGEFVAEAAADPFNRNPMDHLWNSEGQLMVLYFGSGNLYVYDSDTERVDELPVSSHLSGPVNMFFGPEDDLFVLDWNHGEVRRFDGQTYEYKGVFIEGLNATEGFALMPDGTILLSNYNSNTIERFSLESGVHLGTFINSGVLLAPNAIAFLPDPEPTDTDEPEEQPGDHQLNQNYPNPFNPSTVINYSLREPGPVQLAIYDLLGRELERLVDGVQPAGAFQVRYRPESLRSGVYLYRLVTRSGALTRTMTLLQ